jgi:alpha,alpha-trehalase
MVILPNTNMRAKTGAFKALLGSFLLFCAGIFAPSSVLAMSCESALIQPDRESRLETWRSHLLPQMPPQRVEVNVSQTFAHPVLEEIRQQSQQSIQSGHPENAIVEDFKPLSDRIPRDMSEEDLAVIYEQARWIESMSDRREALVFLLDQLFEPGEAELRAFEGELVMPTYAHHGEGIRVEVVQYIESLWADLAKWTPSESAGSILPLPYPILIPGDRFQESYYWDTFFAFKTLIRTGRLELAIMQVENYLYEIAQYGLIPNGSRTYYLSRSQPPMIAAMIREVLTTIKEQNNGELPENVTSWLRTKVLPLLEIDYQEFWMNPETRYHAETGLNHHWDSETTPRPERHGADNDYELGETPQHTRAGAEDGEDFTNAREGQYASIAPIKLNAILYNYERAMSEFYEWVGNGGSQQRYATAAKVRQEAMNRLMLNEEDGMFYDYQLERERQMGHVTASSFALLWANALTHEQAVRLKENVLEQLEVKGGLMASTLSDGGQWDAPNGWLPQHYFAIEGLLNYSFEEDAIRIAEKITTTVETAFKKERVLIERFDVLRGTSPIEDGTKYDTQRGFLWTNGVYIWILFDVLRDEELAP